MFVEWCQKQDTVLIRLSVSSEVFEAFFALVVLERCGVLCMLSV